MNQLRGTALVVLITFLAVAPNVASAGDQASRTAVDAAVSVGMTVRDIDRSMAFHTDVLSIQADSRSNDCWFQHIAIIVRDMDAAYRHLRRHKVEHASTGPQLLPDWNKNAAASMLSISAIPTDIIWKSWNSHQT